MESHKAVLLVLYCFYFYINDIVTVIAPGAKCKLFADDIKMYCNVKCAAGSDVLQLCLDSLAVWCANWQMQVNVQKCGTLNIGEASSRIYRYSGNDIECADSFRDLGITMSKDFKFSVHCANITAQAYKRAALILKCFHSRSTKLLMRAYTVYVRPLLEYSTCVWSAFYEQDIVMIESV